jgi:acyl carrier protein
MSLDVKKEVREFLQGLLAKLGDKKEFADGDSLFLSGRLDSFSMMQLVMHLEEIYGIDFSDINFEMALFDSVDAITNFVEEVTAATR